MSDAETTAREKWHLASLELKWDDWSFRGKYSGSIRFANGESESFTFKIRPEMAQPYIDLIAADIVKGAESLGERLMLSLGLKRPPSP